MGEPFDKPYCSHCEARLKSVFKDVEQPSLSEMAFAKACNFYKKGDIVFEEGAPSEGIYCIHRGKVKVYKHGGEGRDQIVRFAKAGDVVGYRSLVSGEPYAESAAALEESIICCVPRDLFFDMLEKDGRLSMEVIRLLSGQLREAEEKILHLAQKPVRERLAETLLVLKEVYGTENGDNSPLNVTLSREELASVVGTAMETLVRTIADLKRENLIATDKKKIRILDVQGLIEAGNLVD